MKKSLNIRNIMQYICIFLILLYPFNCTISDLIYKNNAICLLTITIGLVGLFILKDKNSLTKKSIFILFGTLLLVILTNYNNYYFKEYRELKPIVYSLYLFLPFLISINRDSIVYFKKVLLLFLSEHLIGTYIGIFFKNFYSKYILKKICTGKVLCTATGNFYHGYIPGFTTHFSTNGIYISIATLYFFSEYLEKKNVKSLILFIASIVALFATGKRAHLIFTLISCIITYLLKNTKSLILKNVKLFVLLIVAIIGYIIFSKYIPELTNIIVRFESLIEQGNIMNGRKELYSLAYSMWNQNILFGNGWGAFSYYYQIFIYSFGKMSYLDAHNVYLQLLCEVGIIGFMIIVSLMIKFFIASLKTLRDNDEKNTFMRYFNFGFQLFFLLYCFTGNPLYDQQCYVVYFILIGYCLMYTYNCRKEVS